MKVKIILLCGWIMVCCALAPAQTEKDKGSIAGTLLDPAGAAITNATLQLQCGKAEYSAKTTTGHDGRYRFDNVPEGPCAITVEAKGFKKFSQEGIAVKAGAESSANFSLSVAGSQASVTVVGGGYVVTTATAGAKIDTPVLDTPISIQSVPKQVITEQRLRTSLEVVENVSGVEPSTYEFYDQFLIRGFDSGYGATFRNDLPLRGITESVNIAFVDRIEVVKGPSSVLYGRIEPGGFVNIVTEKPQMEPAYFLEQQIGQWGGVRSTIGATGPLRSDGSLAYRLTADYDKSGSWVANAHRNNKAGAASIAWRPSEKFNFIGEFERYAYATTWLDASVPVVGNRPADLSRNFSILYPESWSSFPYTVDRYLLGFEWSYQITSNWKIANRFHYVHSTEDQQGVYADWTLGLDTTASKFRSIQFTHNPNWIRKSYAVNLDVTGEFSTGRVRHKILLGFDHSSFSDDTPGSGGDIPDAAPLDIYNPVYSVSHAELQALAASDSTNILFRDRSYDSGFYVQDQMLLGDRWVFLLGGRYDRATDSYSDTYGTRDTACYPNCTGFPLTPYGTDQAFSPRAGLLYRLSPNASVYGSFSRSFGAANGRDNNGNPLRPQIGTQFEAGVKATFHDGAITASASVFDLTKTNILEFDPISFFPEVVGEARSRGLELDIAGRVTRNITILGSYTFDQAKITKDPFNGTPGDRLSGVAPHVGNLWAKFDSAPERARGWSMGAGLYASAARWGDDANTWQLPGFARLDGMASYRFRIGRVSYNMQLNVRNMTDKKYFDHGGFGIAAYGAPRTVSGGIRLDF